MARAPQPLLERLFGLSKSGSNVRTEFVAGLTTFLTMVYIGIGLGFITYALAKIIAGKFADAKPAVLVLAVIFALKFAMG